MVLVDVNVLVYAHREDAADHSRFAGWLTALARGRETFGMSDQVLGAFLRVVTNNRIFVKPSPMKQALAFAEAVRGRPQCVRITPGERHWEIFTDLCGRTGVKGNLVADAWLAALAIESGSEWITTDRDFSRFPGLRWRHPFG